MNTLHALLVVLSVTAMVAGCETRRRGAGTNPTVLAALQQTRAKAVGVYVTQANGSSDGTVYGYPADNKANGSPLCTITGQNFDHSQIAIDASGNVYLPNIQTGAINVYAPDCGELVASVHDPYGSDVDVALGANGTFYGAGRSHVAICTRWGCTSELTDPSIFQIETAAVDASGNVWAAYYNKQGKPSLIVWRRAGMPGKLVSGYVNENTPGDLSFDRSGTLIALQTLFSRVYLYRCDAANATCTNTKTATLRSGALFGALNATNTDFEVSGYPTNEVDVYSHPAFTFEYSYNRGLKPGYSTQGIAQTR